MLRKKYVQRIVVYQSIITFKNAPHLTHPHYLHHPNFQTSTPYVPSINYHVCQFYPSLFLFFHFAIFFTSISSYHPICIITHHYPIISRKHHYTHIIRVHIRTRYFPQIFFSTSAGLRNQPTIQLTFSLYLFAIYIYVHTHAPPTTQPYASLESQDHSGHHSFFLCWLRVWNKNYLGDLTFLMSTTKFYVQLCVRFSVPF